MWRLSEEPWKNTPDSKEEGTFGLTKYAGAGPDYYRTVSTAGGTYRVDRLVDKPAWDSLRDAFRRR